ncbi:lebercilin isoform X1 [Pygocentrus nattereri]|uniref:Lebercilin domain-containing protein n=1 Tax=Pygocentrus nattereri TaxID=42514 RepID=A0A3B4D5E5_PYGNA|nr:lebercilin isoform X1 [Pygocentrus nattereri]
MDSQNTLDSFEDNRMRESEQSPLSHHRDRKDSDSSFQPGKQNGKFHEDVESSSLDRARTRTREPKQDPDQDRISEGEHSSASFYSDDYENVSQSERSFSPQSPLLSAHRAGRARRVSSSPLHRTGVRKGVPRRPGPQAYHPQQRSSGFRSQSISKDTPPKDLDLVTKRLLSARLLKISELKNALSELRVHADELQRENRLLRQLQLRHEKALQRYSDTESEISQLISRHNNETHALRERLRRSQERERTAERSYREADAQLQRCRSQLQKLQQLADDQNLGEREELSRKLTHAQAKAQESERRVKELEKNMELNNGSFQRQLASERRKTHEALQEAQTLREEVERLSAKLKEKERELDARNIYANRILRTTSKKESENFTKRKGPLRNSSKAVQTEERAASLDFPSPPPAITDGSELPPDDHADDYLSLKVRRPTLNQNRRIKKQELQSSEQRQKEAEEWRIQEMERERERARARETEHAFAREREKEKESERLREKERKLEKEKERHMAEKQRADQEFNSDEEKGTSQRDEWDRGEGNSKRRSQYQSEEEKRKPREQVEEEQWMREQEIQANQERAEDERRRKEQLLAKMHEIDMQAQGQDSDFFSDETGSLRSPPRLSEPQNQNASIFSFTQPEEGLSTPGAGKRGGALRVQRTNQDLDFAFGSYEPSFGKPAPRAGHGHHNQSQTYGQLPGEEDTGLDLNGLVKERKSNLMQQLFGSTASSPPPDPSRKMELLSSPSTPKPISGVLSGRRRDVETPNRLNDSTLSFSKSVLQVSESRPAVRAITSFDDDIEEVTL